MLFSSRPVSWLVVFLGNPGLRYEGTRHNAGFMTADALEKELGVKINRSRFKALTATATIGGESVMLMKPQTDFMDMLMEFSTSVSKPSVKVDLPGSNSFQLTPGKAYYLPVNQ